MTTTLTSNHAATGPTFKGNRVLYWGTTGLLGVALIGSGLAKLTAQAPMVENMEHLGYPTYLLTILGSWMLAGAIALFVPGMPRLKEWAYAGIIFQMTGAAASHALAGDSFAQSMPGLVFAGLAVASYLLRPSTRRIPELAPSTSSPSAPSAPTAALPAT